MTEASGHNAGKLTGHCCCWEGLLGLCLLPLAGQPGQSFRDGVTSPRVWLRGKLISFSPCFLRRGGMKSEGCRLDMLDRQEEC